MRSAPWSAATRGSSIASSFPPNTSSDFQGPGFRRLTQEAGPCFHAGAGAPRYRRNSGMALAATEAGLDQTQGVDMDPKSGKPPLVFVNPFAIWTELAL